MQSQIIPTKIIMFDKDCQALYPKFVESVLDQASSMCTGVFGPGIGLIHCVQSDAKWELEHPGVDKPALEALVALAQNPSTAAVAHHDRTKKTIEEVTEKKTLLKNMILQQLGEDNVSLIKVLGTVRLVSLLQIMEKMEEIHSVPDESIITSFYAALETPKNTETFVRYSSNFRTIFGSLSLAGINVDEFNKIKYLSNGIAHLSNYKEAVKDYKKINPVVKEQTFESLVTYIMVQKGNIESTAAEAGFKDAFVGSAVTREEFNKLNSEIASLKAANSMAFEKGRKQGIEEAKAGGKIVAQRTLYCWKHGTGGHHGNTCDEMSKNNRAKYTNQQRGARKPSDCPDGAAPV